MIARRGDGWQATLPSEAEWEGPARFPDGRVYPWGSELNPQAANCLEAGIGSIAPVGCFPAGRSSLGLLDLSGNVWEWTRSIWGPDPERPNDIRRYMSKAASDAQSFDGVYRVLRGGSWRSDRDMVRCSARYRQLPSDRFDDVGFRVVILADPIEVHR
jgi:formylglycine-generating enzyme required for sulfatase activity